MVKLFQEVEMVRVRFAPSPTGLLHQGNIRTALYNCLFAKQNGGTAVLRIDDTDQERSQEDFVQAIERDLKTLGLQFDEGFGIGGNFGPYRQGERLSFYQKYLHQLIEAGKAYPCFATNEEIEAERRRALATGKAFVFRSKDRDLNPTQREEKIAQGLKPHYRFAVDRDIVKFHDLVYGDKIFDTGTIGDFTVARSDDSPLYLFASAIDDALMQITHVIRGEDGMSNTPRQILIQKALGFESPQFAHLPLILGPDHTLLSKRNGSASVSELTAKGYLPHAILNYLALMGWSPPAGRDILSIEELIQNFRLEKVSRSSAIFDWDKLNFVNNHYLRHLSDEEYLAKARPIVNRENPNVGGADASVVDQAILALRPNVKTLEELPKWLVMMLGEPVPSSDEAKEFMQLKESPKVWESVMALLSDLSGEFNEENVKHFLDGVQKKSKVKGRKLFMPIRVALTGSTEGPELTQIFSCLGKTRIGERIQRAIANLQHQDAS
jgi:nondiscriminating glutamyl-tRNA synthetase